MPSLHECVDRVTITHTCSDAPQSPLNIYLAMRQVAKFRRIYLYLRITCSTRQTLVLITEKALILFLAVISVKLSQTNLTESTVHIVLKMSILHMTACLRLQWLHTWQTWLAFYKFNWFDQLIFEFFRYYFKFFRH